MVAAAWKPCWQLTKSQTDLVRPAITQHVSLCHMSYPTAAVVLHKHPGAYKWNEQRRDYITHLMSIMSAVPDCEKCRYAVCHILEQHA